MNNSSIIEAVVEPEKTVVSVQVKSGCGIYMSRSAPPEMKAYEVEIAPLFSFVSAGTELAVLEMIKNAEKNDYRVDQLGYSQSGVITRIGEAVKNLKVGDTVAAIGAGAFHATRTVLAQNLVAVLPEGVSPREAALAAMFCFSLEGVRKSQVQIGENVIVFGGGTMGQITARLYELMGARVAVMDSNPYRMGFLPKNITSLQLDEDGWLKLSEWAAPYGVEHASICFGGDASNTIKRLKNQMSCSPEGIPHGRVVFPGGARLSVTMASDMGNIQFLSSAKAGPGYRDPIYEAGANYPMVYVGHTVRRNVEIFFSLLKDRRLDISSLISHTFRFAEAPKAYEMLQKPKVEALAVLLEYSN